ncbi:hypothetical protein ACJX0J_027983, partial [Zea mays]
VKTEEGEGESITVIYYFPKKNRAIFLGALRVSDSVGLVITYLKPNLDECGLHVNVRSRLYTRKKNIYTKIKLILSNHYIKQWSKSILIYYINNA